MKTFDLHDKEGRLHAFEISNSGIGRRGVLKVVRAIPGARVTREPMRFLSWFREDEFCEFVLNDRTFIAQEPFGDNSRYWIGTRPPGWCPELNAVREAFVNWRS